MAWAINSFPVQFLQNKHSRISWRYTLRCGRLKSGAVADNVIKLRTLSSNSTDRSLSNAPTTTSYHEHQIDLYQPSTSGPLARFQASAQSKNAYKFHCTAAHCLQAHVFVPVCSNKNSRNQTVISIQLSLEVQPERISGMRISVIRHPVSCCGQISRNPRRWRTIALKNQPISADVARRLDTIRRLQ